MAEQGNEDDQLKKIAEYIISMSGGKSSMYQKRETTDGTGRGANKDDLIEQSKLTSDEIKKLNKTMLQLGKDKFDNSQLAKFPEELRKSMRSVNTKFSKQLADNIKTLDDALAVKDKVDAGKLLVVELKKLRKKEKLTADDVEKLGDIAHAAGVRINEFIDVENNRIKGIEKLDEEFTELADAVDGATDKTMKHSKSLNKATFFLSKFSGKLIEAGKVYADELRIARERGAYDAQYSDALLKMGISMKAYTTNIADNRDVMQSMSAAGGDSLGAWQDNQSSIVRFSRDLEQAASTGFLLQRALTGFGTRVKDVDGAIKDQTKMYEENFFIWGDTMEEYAKSMVALGEDSDIRRNLSMMQEKQRKEYIKGIVAQESYRRELGYTKEEARELTKTFAAMGGESPKERMKKAAKQRALMGALGMGAEGAELQQLMNGLNQLNPEDRAKAEIRIEEIQREMANAVKGKYSESLGSEMFFRQLVDKAGVGDLLDKLETNSKEAKAKNKEEAQARADARKVPLALSKGLDIYDTFNAFQKTSVGLLAGILANLVLSNLSSLGGIMKGGFGMLKGGMGKIASMAAGTWAATKTVASKVVNKGAGTAATAATKAAGGVTAGVVGKSLTKGAIKTGIKAIPGLGALAGIGFGISRAMDGDFVGAGLEVAAGVAGILPGWGTAASVAISGGLAARDIAGAGDVGRSAEKATTAANASVEGDTSGQVSTNKEKNFVTALNEMTTYIKEVNTQNSELALSVQTLAEALTTDGRINKMNRGRPPS